MGLVAPRHVGSSRTRDRTPVPCISKRILNHCATREVPLLIFSNTNSEKIKQYPESIHLSAHFPKHKPPKLRTVIMYERKFLKITLANKFSIQNKLHHSYALGRKGLTAGKGNSLALLGKKEWKTSTIKCANDLKLDGSLVNLSMVSTSRKIPEYLSRKC